MTTSKLNPAGIKPGLTKDTEPQEKLLNLKCRNPRGCDSNQATEVGLDGPKHYGQRLYRCAQCGHTWGVALGGHFEI